MLALQNVSLRAGGKLLLKQANLSIHPGQRIGLIGQNGSGKTTLFKSILDEHPLEEGRIIHPANWVIGYVEQEVKALDLGMLEYVCFGDSQYAEAQKMITQAQRTQNHQALVKAYDVLDRIDGFLVPNQAQQLLYGLGFTSDEFEQPVSEFSGGWQVRLMLARALMQRSDLLLLDEPTNHLDIEAVSWLIQWLNTYSGAMLIVSHDRDFLDQVVQGIAHIHQHDITFYSGNFASFERQRHEKLIQQQALYDKQTQQMQHLKRFIERFKAKASKAKQAQSRIKALERMEKVVALQATNPFSFQFFPPQHQPDPMLSLENVEFSYEKKCVLRKVSLALRAGDRIGLVGVNGSGKSTLIKLLVSELKPDKGEIRVSRGVKIGYFAQHQLESLNYEQSPLQHLLALSEAPSDQEARNFLGHFGFSSTQCLDKVEHFSGGEKARLALALIIYQKPNLVILDEPTNHLDMETRDALDMALQSYEGALILVTHDKHLLASIADQYWCVHESQVSHFMGDLDAYLQTRLMALKEQTSSFKSSGQHKSKKQVRQAKAQQRKQVEASLKPIKLSLKHIESQLERLQAKQQKYHMMMEDCSLYEACNKAKLTRCLKEQAECEQAIEVCEQEWLALQEQIEAISQAEGIGSL